MKTESEYPLVSCICITKNRPEMLLKSVVSFDEQDYINKELVISYPKTDQETKKLIAYLLEKADITIIIVERDDEDSIGKARNDAITLANGEYVCMWDDDDLYDPTRITIQYEALLSNDGQFQSSILIQIFLYHAYRDTGYLSFPSYWGCTLFCRKDHLLNHPCADRNEFEYTPILNYLQSRNLLLPIGSNPSLYTYVFHGGNLMKYTTFLYLINQSYPVQEEISQALQHYYELKFSYQTENNS